MREKFQQLCFFVLLLLLVKIRKYEPKKEKFRSDAFGYTQIHRNRIH